MEKLEEVCNLYQKRDVLVALITKRFDRFYAEEGLWYWNKMYNLHLLGNDCYNVSLDLANDDLWEFYNKLRDGAYVEDDGKFIDAKRFDWVKQYDRKE